MTGFMPGPHAERLRRDGDISRAYMRMVSGFGFLVKMVKLGGESRRGRRMHTCRIR